MPTAERREPDAVVGGDVAIDQAQRGAVGQQHVCRSLGQSQLSPQNGGRHRAVRGHQENRSNSVTAAISRSAAYAPSRTR